MLIKNLFTIALPIILQNFLSSLVNMLDTIMVGQLGEQSIAAVGLGNQIFFVLNIMMFGIVSGGSIFIAQYWGKKDLKSVYQVVGITLSASFLGSIIFFLAATFAPEFCLRIYTKDQAVIEKGVSYLRTAAPSYLLFGLSMPIAHALRSTERVKLPMIATGVSVLANALLNFLFIFGVNINGIQIIPEMGIVGAALATCISRLIELLILVITAYSRKYEIAVPPYLYFQIKPDFIPRYLKVCIPVLLNESLWGFGASLYNSIYAHAGTDIIAAFNIASTITQLIWTYFIGCGNATAILLGKTIGEGRYDEAKTTAKKLTFFLMGCAVILGLLFIPLSFLLKYLYKVEPDVIHKAQVLLWIAVALIPLWACNMAMVVGVCRSGGDTVYALIMDIGAMWLLSLPLGFCAVKFWHLPFWAIYLCIQSENLFKISMGLSRLLSGKWLHDVTVK